MAEWLELSPWLFAALTVTVFLGAAFQNLFGIGFGIFASPIMLILDHRLLPSVILMLGIVSSFPHAVTNLRKLNVSHCTAATIGRLVGSVAGAYLLVQVIGGTGNQTFELVFAATLILGILLNTIGRWAKFFSPSVPKLTVASFVSGLAATMTSIGGPPIAIIYRLEPPSQARAHLSFMICTGAIMSLIALAYEGVVGELQLKAAAMLFVPAVLGVWCSKRYTELAHRHFRSALLGVVIISALVIVVRAFE